MIKNIIKSFSIIAIVLFAINSIAQCPSSCGISATDEQGVTPCDGTVTVSGNFSVPYLNSHFSFTIIDSVTNLVVDSAYSTQKPYIFTNVCAGTYFYRIYDSIGNTCCSTAPCVGTGVAGCSGGGSGGSATVNPYRDIQVDFTPYQICVSETELYIPINEISGTNPPFDVVCNIQINGQSQSQSGVLDGEFVDFYFTVPLGSGCDIATLIVTDSTGYTESFDVSQLCYEPPLIHTISSDACAGSCDGTIYAWVENWNWQDNWNSAVELVGPSGPISAYIGGAYDTIVFENLCPGATYSINYFDCINLGQPYINVNQGASPVNSSASPINGACSNCQGEATASGSGGAGSYTYEWFDAFANSVSVLQSPNDLCAGDYDVVVIDGNGCSDTSSVTIADISNLVNSGTEIVSTCDSFSWIDGNTYTSSNNSATHTLTNIHGCDSVVTLNLTITNSSSGTDIVSSCDSYMWIDGITYTSSNNTATYVLPNAQNCDSTVTLDLTINYGSSSTDKITACGSYTWIDGVTYTSSNSSATHTLPTIHGCDSVVTLNLTIGSSPDISTTVNAETIVANNTNATYQWIDCDNGNVAIAGETNQSFTATANGNYAVVITENTCIDTSACISIASAELTEQYSSQQISVHPNPTSDRINVESDFTIKNIMILDVTGKTLLYRNSISSKHYQLDLSLFENGTYLLILENQDGQLMQKRIIISK